MIELEFIANMFYQADCRQKDTHAWPWRALNKDVQAKFLNMAKVSVASWHRAEDEKEYARNHQTTGSIQPIENPASVINSTSAVD